MRRPTGATQRWHEATAAWVVHWKSTRNDPVSAKWCTWCYSCLWRVFESVPVVYYALSFARILSIAPVLSIAPSLAPVLARATSRPEPHPEDGTALPRTRPVDPQSGAAQASHVLGREGQQGAAPAAGRQRGGATHISPTARPVTSGGAASPRIALPAPPGHSLVHGCLSHPPSWRARTVSMPSSGARRRCSARAACRQLSHLLTPSPSSLSSR